MRHHRRLVDKCQQKMIGVMFLFIIVMRTGILSGDRRVMVAGLPEKGNVGYLLPFVSCTCFRIATLLYRIWSKKY